MKTTVVAALHPPTGGGRKPGAADTNVERLAMKPVYEPHPARGLVPVISNYFSGVMAGLVPAIHVFPAEARKKDVDARDNPRIESGDGHDGGEVIRFRRNALSGQYFGFDFMRSIWCGAMVGCIGAAVIPPFPESR